MQTVTLKQLSEISILDNAKEFVELLEQGIKSWNKAGAVLVELLRRDKDVFHKIHAAHPHISMATLHVFARIGYGQVYAPLLLDTSPGAQKLLECPRKVQEELMDKKIEIAVAWNRGKITTSKKSIHEMTRAEAALVFDGGEVRNVEQQAFRLRERKPEEKQAVNIPNERVVNEDIGYFSLVMDAEGNVTVKPCNKSAMAQPIRLLPTPNGEKLANVVFYIQKRGGVICEH